jgi:hypothetical protein
MTAILDRMLRAQALAPRNPLEYLALQIARKLSDLEHAREYAVLLEHFPEEIILHAFRRARSRNVLNREGFLSAFRSLTIDAHELPSDGD